MIDESLLKSNFIGRDGFRWWIGQIPPEESMSEQLNKDGWGNRTKVRILGYHPYDDGELPNEELPWAQILLSTTDGSGASNMATNHKIRPGDVVFGFFLDGDNAQIPVISGVFGRTDQVPTTTYTSPFVPFTGFTSRIENDGSRLKANEENEQTCTTQESPVHRPPSTANASNQISYSSVIGDTVYFATAQTDSKMNKIATELENAIKFLQDIQSYPNVAQEWINNKRDQLCEEITEKIKGITTEIISGVVNDSYEQLIPVLNEATELLYDFVYQPLFIATGSASTAHLGAGSAQNATIQPVEQLQTLIPCLISSIIDSVADLLGDMICSILENVASFASCVIDQFLGGLLNSIINLIISGMQSVLGALSILLNFSGFNIADAIRQTAEGLFGIPLSINCGEGLGDLADNVSKWTIGSGAQLSSSFDVDNILNLANQSNVGSLDACVPVIPSAPKFNIFGGRGSGASASPVFGSIRGEGNNRTASIIGAIVTSGGSGYTNPPFVTIRDDTNNGYGFSGRTILDGDEVVGVIVNSPGENYPVGNQPTPSDIIGTGETPVIAGGTGGTPVTAGGTGGTPVTAGGIPLTAGGTPVTAGGTGGTPVTAGGTPVTAGGNGGTPVTSGGTGGTPLTAGETPVTAGGTPVTDGGTPVTAGGTGGTIVTAGGTGGTIVTAGGTGGTLVTAGGTGGTLVTAGGTGGTLVTAGGTGGTTVTVDGTGITDLITVDKIFIENPGFNYQETDVVTDNFGNEYNMVIDNGSIVNVTPINIKEITDLPYIKIISKTGSGARLKPIFGFRKDFTGQVAQVIDCIT